jgi:hypothetical protein
MNEARRPQSQIDAQTMENVRLDFPCHGRVGSTSTSQYCIIYYIIYYIMAIGSAAQAHRIRIQPWRRWQ